MSVERIVPDFETTRLEASRDLYTGLIGLRVAMDLGWIVTVQSPTNKRSQISFLTHDATASVVPGLSIEVSDVDAVHAEAERRGETIVYPLTDEPWGVRRFFVLDPNGVVVNVMEHRER